MVIKPIWAGLPFLLIDIGAVFPKRKPSLIKFRLKMLCMSKRFGGLTGAETITKLIGFKAATHDNHFSRVHSRCL